MCCRQCIPAHAHIVVERCMPALILPVLAGVDARCLLGVRRAAHQVYLPAHIPGTCVGRELRGSALRVRSYVCTSMRCTEGYVPIPEAAKEESSFGINGTGQKTFTYPVNQAYNYFHPDRLPPALQAYAEVTYFTAEQLANFFGFQDDNVRNQVEHILSLVANHRRFCDAPTAYEPFDLLPSTGVHSLHARLFENYRGWCKTLNVQPKFTPTRGGGARRGGSSSGGGGSAFATPTNQQDEVSSLMTDVMLYMCVWGEAANLRHMPESLCFLYHKMMQEFLVHRDATGEQAALYAGYFLDHVVTPIWEVVLRHHKVKGDHVKARNYDDFNEFFWSPACLKYSYRDIDQDAVPMSAASALSKGYGPPPTLPVVPVHKALVRAPKTFLEKRSLLSAVLTFNRILEFHIVTFYLCGMYAFGDLLVWDAPYMLQMLSSVFIIINLLGLCWCMLEVWQAFPGINISGTAKAGFLVRLGTRFLVLVYQSLYFMWSVETESDKAGMVMQGPPLYWWWQYLWLSAVIMFSYFVEGFFQIVPWLTTYVCTRDNDYVNAFLNLCFPLSRLYVGKAVHESLRNALKYAFFWSTLLAWKIWFSYQYEVRILISPTIEIFDDYVNFPDQSFVRVFSLIVLRWVPQAFIYLIDTSIWFACWSAIAGSVIGFQKRLGEVRDFATMRAAFMRIPEEFCSKRQIAARFLEVRTQKWAAFAAVWNEVINKMRESDVISNEERDMLKFHKFVGFMKPVYLPIFQTAGSVERAVHTMADEAWELCCWFLRHLLGPLHESEIGRVEATVSSWLASGDVMANVRLEKMPSVMADATAIVSILHAALPKRSISFGLRRASSTSGLSELQTASTSDGSRGSGSSGGGGDFIVAAEAPLSVRHGNLRPRSAVTAIPDKTRDQVRVCAREVVIGDGVRKVRDKLRPLLNNIRGMMKSAVGDAGAVQDLLSFVLSMEQGFMWDDAYATARLDRLSEHALTKSILSKLYGLLAIQAGDAEPASPEARRRLTFFVNSLFMDMPRAPQLANMLSWSCVTPYYSEDVLYGRKDLEKRNEDGLSMLMYLQALYKHDWHNFLERNGISDEQQIWSKKHFQELRLWASMRAQTLSRTVEGMMYYEAALRLLALLEKVPQEQVEALIRRKFQFVVSCQVYGRMKKIQDPKADDIDRLLKRYENLRIAYIDELPGNPVIGEGKPENQNHALIFTRGEHVQAIDMNQEGYFEEAIKMRCLLQEFLRKRDPPTTIVGFREHIFTGSVSSLANYMALQELSFVTIGQRVLDDPLRIRMHYGHPDLFDKVFFMTRGGMSKASKGINLSEDIFAGYNNTIRGGQVVFCEYAQVGKGRDVGMQQIYKFEAKLAQGAAEQSLSRDVNRLGARLDFFRLVSFYFGGLGYYIGNFITIVTIVFVVYFMLALSVFQAEKIGERKITPEGTLQMLLAGMGVLNTLPMLATLMVEKGLRAALITVGQVFVSGGPMYFMFHIQTRAHYFYQTLLAGGAQYRATGRGFVTHHSSFDDLYRFFATSHFYLGFELGVALVIMAFMTSAHQYFGRTWSLWLACVSFLFAPFWFNPLSFEWGKCMDDYRRWVRWMSGTGGSSSNSWDVWWREENLYVSKFGLGQKLQCMLKPAFYLVVGPRISTRATRLPGKLLISTAVFYGGVYLMVTEYEYIRIAIGLYYVISAVGSVSVLLGFEGIRHAYHIHDFILGNIMFLVLFIFAALQLPKNVQTWLLFHNALSQGVVIEDILKYARRTQEQSKSEDVDDTAILKKYLRTQSKSEDVDDTAVLKKYLRTQGKSWCKFTDQLSPAIPSTARSAKNPGCCSMNTSGRSEHCKNYLEVKQSLGSAESEAAGLVVCLLAERAHLLTIIMATRLG
ncbi:1,3-beta-glucan synthase component-domain-containing protein [Tribonema minus]|uniref:1,3-beta-glucan synthase n=1 Tax=Tribonema minus TaxID=303371 RepID=A0A835Z4B5_9STRA|nr:1,3-beta-glucan synthase component-domain-containing protein [Tribonema minus]